MAIDTAQKRVGMLNFSTISTDLLPVPSGTISASGRSHLLDLYSGIALAGAVAAGWAVRTMFLRRRRL